MQSRAESKNSGHPNLWEVNLWNLTWSWVSWFSAIFCGLEEQILYSALETYWRVLRVGACGRSWRRVLLIDCRVSRVSRMSRVSRVSRVSPRSRSGWSWIGWRPVGPCGSFWSSGCGSHGSCGGGGGCCGISSIGGRRLSSGSWGSF